MTETEYQRQKKVEEKLKEIIKRRELARKHYSWIERTKGMNFNYIQTWIRVPFGQSNSKKSQNIDFWN